MHRPIILLTLGCSLTIGCTHASTADQSAPSADAGVILLPSIPDSLRAPESRAAYLSEHYWDNADFSNAAVMNDTAMVEQAFVDYIDILKIVDNDSIIDSSISRLIEKSSSDRQAYKLIAYLAEKYLYETESPMLDEDCYLRFLNVYRALSEGDNAAMLRIDEKITNIGMNKVGTMIPDLTLTTFDNAPVSLHDLSAGSPAIVLIYDNDCEYCQETVEDMMADSRLTDKLDDDKVVVVAIDLGLKSNHLPLRDIKNWYWTWTEGDIDAEITYRDTPAIYVIDQDKLILIKDASYDYVSKAIFH